MPLDRPSRRVNGWRVLIVAALFGVALWGNLALSLSRAPAPPVLAPPVARPEPTVTPRPDAATLISQRAPLGMDFAAFYAANQGSRWLGDALTPEVTFPAGREQYFVGGVLRQTTASTAPITVVPIVGTLVGAGAQIALGGSDALTYAALRPLAAPDQRVTPPWWWQRGVAAATFGIFTRQGRRAGDGASVGHYIPAVFAAFLTGFGDWQSLFGLPLTEAQPITLAGSSGAPRVLVQAFDRAVLVANRDGAPDVRVQPAGADDLAIFGPPAADATPAAQSVWLAGGTVAVLLGPAFGPPVATFFTAAPITLVGDAVWINGVLWQHIRWQNLDQSRDGWVMTSQIATAAPAQGAQVADLSALSPHLGALAAAQSDSVGIAVYLPDDGRYYVDNPDLPLTTASTFKVPILLTLLWQSEQQGRGLTSGEQNLAAAMIDASDNDAASALYAEIGYDAGVNAFMAAAGIGGLIVNTAAFGESTMTPRAMTQLLAALWGGAILTGPDRQYALDLMSHVDPTEQSGIGDTAPAGASIALKDGWIDDDDGWVTDSVGIVTDQGHTVIVSVFVRRQAGLDWTVADALCGPLFAALFGGGSGA